MDPFLQGSPVSSVALNPDTPLPSVEGPPDSHQEKPTRPPEEGEGRVPRGFSPDYDPSPKAVIRKVDADNIGSELHPVATPNRLPAGPEESPPKSFLRDNSDSEDSPVRQRKAPRSEPREKNLRPVVQSDPRTRSPSPVVSKAKSVPNLNREARLSAQSKRTPSTRNDRRESGALGLTLETGGGNMYKHNVPSLRIESAEPSPKGMGTGSSINLSAKSIDEPEIVVGDPTEDDRQKAQKIFEGNEDFIQKDRAAAWMGEEGIVRQRTLRAYMELYDFEGHNIVTTLRQVCQRLLLRAETQQVDRILVAFSKRWCDCNANHGFKSIGKSLPYLSRRYLLTRQTLFTPYATRSSCSTPIFTWPTSSTR
jgi:hypothetical protein